ncbi:molecular chaperone [Samsonia erythrinae]|uniref:Fimbrial chaperone protein n=1 Tax=Samsonia erythrinae TaxID=160434 RepID=A0A4R3VQQ9_9GAMM|nr:molecular chaperone [Samsonia erythrinae]TCV07045.1 fimbrial chaperone protein [Samsonia erythrinae]
MIRKKSIFIGVVAFILSAFTGACFAASSILVWPIYQVIEADENGSALWLENKGKNPVALQIRIMSWRQIDYQDRYAQQSDVIGTPPFMRLEPGKRNMVRLMRVKPVAPNTEQSYRIIIDEIAEPYEQKENPKMGLQFQMRYLLPLFLTGNGVQSNLRPEKIRPNSTITSPILSWRVNAVAGKNYLYVRNRGVVHARLNKVYWSSDPDGKKINTMISEGFLGYVLPGQEMRWPLPAGVSAPGSTMQLFTEQADSPNATLIKRE